MREYFYPSYFFKKKWIWFAEPFEVPAVDLVNFFSYKDVLAPGFKKKRGLTTVINLEKDLGEIYEGMRKNFVRKQIEKGERKGVTVKRDDNFRSFREIYDRFRKEKNLPRESLEAFKRGGTLFSAYYENNMVAGGVFVEDENNMRAWVLASLRLDGLDGPLKETVGQANRLVIWEAIKYAKAKGLKRFDLGGLDKIKDGQPTQLNIFKESFGGETVESFFYYKVYSSFLRFWLKIRNLLKK